MRILFLNWKDLAHPAAGGAEVLTEEVARALVRRGHGITLFASRVGGRPSHEVVEGVQVVRAGGRLGVYRQARRFWRDKAPDSYDLVVDEINTRPFLTPRWIRGVPIVAHINQLAREVWFSETPLPVALLGRYVLEPRWLALYQDVPAITISNSSADSLMRLHGWRDVSVIPMGSRDGEIVRAPKEAAPTVVFIGRLVRMKRPDHAVRAFAMLRAAHPNARLWIIGDGPLHERLAREREPGVELLGRIEDAERTRRLACAHVLIATSVREGWGLTVSEAAACGTPSIGYRVPGLVDSLGASGGALVDPEPEALGRALVAFFDGRLTLEPRPSTVSWDTIAEAYEARLEQVLERFRRRR